MTAGVTGSRCPTTKGLETSGRCDSSGRSVTLLPVPRERLPCSPSGTSCKSLLGSKWRRQLGWLRFLSLRRLCAPQKECRAAWRMCPHRKRSFADRKEHQLNYHGDPRFSRPLAVKRNVNSLSQCRSNATQPCTLSRMLSKPVVYGNAVNTPELPVHWHARMW